MNFGQAVDAVLGITKRPEKLAEAKLAINRSLETYVKASNWSADLVELTVTIDPNEYAQSFLISAELENFRKMKYIRPTGWNKYLKYLEPDKIFMRNERGVDVQNVNVWYRAGDRIVFSVSALVETLEIGYYRLYPYLTQNTATHWMLDAMPGVIIDSAIADIFTSIGSDSEAATYRGHAQRGFLVAEGELSDGADRYTVAGRAHA